MQRTARRLSGALLLALLWNLSPAGLHAQIRILGPTTEATADDVSGVLERGHRFESQARWGEAINLYEESLREHPGDQELTRHHDLAKIHYDLGRRYHDTSFLRALATLPLKDALALYGEVLLKIQSHYVSEPNWKALVQRGTQGLQVALGEEAYLKHNLPRRPSAAELQGAVQQIDSLIRARNVRTRQEAQDAVAAASQLGTQLLRIPAAAVTFEYTCGATGSLDEYSSYLTGDQLNDVYSQIEGNFVGLGIELKSAEGALQIVKVITGSPAEKAGIKAGDRITAVDGHSTVEMNTDQAADLLQGVEGSLAEVTVLNGGGSRTVTVKRAHVEVPSIDDVKIIDREYGIGYLKLTCFQKTTSRDLDTALWKLHRDGMKSLVIDVRGNPGGLLTASVEVADKFVDDGVIVSTRGRSSAEDYNYTGHQAGTWRVPLVLLIDGDSASASEILAGAIRDHRRGTIVGQRSYGKGSVQGIFPLNAAGAGVRLTTAKFYSPSGKPISKVGVSPDITVQKVAKPLAGEATAEAAIGGEDATLAAGLQAAKRQIAKR
jgi:carboxyl-terminal processing protease